MKWKYKFRFWRLGDANDEVTVHNLPIHQTTFSASKITFNQASAFIAIILKDKSLAVGGRSVGSIEASQLVGVSHLIDQSPHQNLRWRHHQFSSPVNPHSIYLYAVWLSYIWKSVKLNKYRRFAPFLRFVEKVRVRNWRTLMGEFDLVISGVIN